MSNLFYTTLNFFESEGVLRFRSGLQLLPDGVTIISSKTIVFDGSIKRPYGGDLSPREVLAVSKAIESAFEDVWWEEDLFPSEDRDQKAMDECPLLIL